MKNLKIDIEFYLNEIFSHFTSLVFVASAIEREKQKPEVGIDKWSKVNNNLLAAVQLFHLTMAECFTTIAFSTAFAVLTRLLKLFY